MVDSNSKTYSFGNDTYSYKETLGKGTYGTVVKAMCNKTKKEIAIKKIKLDKTEFDRALGLIKDGNLNPYVTFKAVKAEI